MKYFKMIGEETLKTKKGVHKKISRNITNRRPRDNKYNTQVTIHYSRNKFMISVVRAV